MKKPIYKALLCRAQLHINRYTPGQAGVQGRAFVLRKMLIGILSEKQDDSDFLFPSLDLYFLGDLQLAFVLSKEAEKEARPSNCSSGAVIHTARPTGRGAEARASLCQAARAGRCRLLCGQSGHGELEHNVFPRPQPSPPRLCPDLPSAPQPAGLCVSSSIFTPPLSA